jgi:hypothetical protein
MEDYYLNPEANDELWEAFFCAAYRATIPSAKLAEYGRGLTVVNESRINKRKSTQKSSTAKPCG